MPRSEQRGLGEVRGWALSHGLGALKGCHRRGCWKQNLLLQSSVPSFTSWKSMLAHEAEYIHRISHIEIFSVCATYLKFHRVYLLCFSFLLTYALTMQQYLGVWWFGYSQESLEWRSYATMFHETYYLGKSMKVGPIVGKSLSENLSFIFDSLSHLVSHCNRFTQLTLTWVV